MKVLFILPTPWSMSYGGIDIQFHKTKIGLERRGIDVVSVDYFDPNLLEKVDLVHFFGIGPMYHHIGRLLKGKGIPYVISTVYYHYGRLAWRAKVRGRILSRLPETSHSLIREFLLGSEAYLPNSQAEADQLTGFLGLERSKIFVIPNGVDENFIGDSKTYLDFHHPPRLGDRFIISVARIVPRKNTLNLLKSVLLAQTPIVLIGQKVLYGDVGSSERLYVEEVDKVISGNPDLIYHIPHLSHENGDLASAMAAANGHALVSILETPGLANLEAGLNGCNLVVGSCPPVDEYLKNVAQSVNQNNIQEIAHSLRYSLEQPKNSKRQSQFIASKYTWTTVAEETEKVYLKVLS